MGSIEVIRVYDCSTMRYGQMKDIWNLTFPQRCIGGRLNSAAGMTAVASLAFAGVVHAGSGATCSLRIAMRRAVGPISHSPFARRTDTLKNAFNFVHHVLSG